MPGVEYFPLKGWIGPAWKSRAVCVEFGAGLWMDGRPLGCVLLRGYVRLLIMSLDDVFKHGTGTL